ncbi:MAG: hypothetical protein EZS28_007306 [Streblomastix strix]|uniref:Uncharacterized protein n=1 Tax=Streblomastix strix TaxID=222440 RepID=A0A5J4WPV1_9EUKA|nr:MAG: hypothetical protein EZS28_007306 [Streblomastix strix]
MGALVENFGASKTTKSDGSENSNFIRILYTFENDYSINQKPIQTSIILEPQRYPNKELRQKEKGQQIIIHVSLGDRVMIDFHISPYLIFGSPKIRIPTRDEKQIRREFSES